jgi:hypothetical protein
MKHGSEITKKGDVNIMTAKQKMDAFLFIDTNILLDLYRGNGKKSDSSLKFLKKIEKCKDRLILTSQVEMEYKKNRQNVILKSLNDFCSPEWNKLTAPALLPKFQPVAMIEKKKIEIKKQQAAISKKIQNILEKPGIHDEGYKILQRIFKNNSRFNLNRTSEQRYAIRRLARKRFCLGYPPRKNGDTSIGDAINWEWIVQCAIDSGKDVVIVSRDGDYGIEYPKGQKWHLNDWLNIEFKERVSRTRKILLTGKLSEALKIIKVRVTKAMEADEARIIERQKLILPKNETTIESPYFNLNPNTNLSSNDLPSPNL